RMPTTTQNGPAETRRRARTNIPDSLSERCAARAPDRRAAARLLEQGSALRVAGPAELTGRRFDRRGDLALRIPVADHRLDHEQMMPTLCFLLCETARERAEEMIVVVNGENSCCGGQ